MSSWPKHVLCTLSAAWIASSGWLPAADQSPPSGGAATILQDFSVDPNWDGYRNQLRPAADTSILQQFGWSCSRYAGGDGCGEIGGRIQRSLGRARFSMPLETAMTLDDRLEVSGRMAVRHCDGASGALIGWFHESSDGWRTPNSMAMRVDGNGDTYWIFAEYGTHQRRTGGLGAFEGERYQTTTTKPFAADGTSHRWSLVYDPDAGEGHGAIQLQIDDRSWQVVVSAEARQDGAQFNRFGLWNQQTTGDGMELWIDDLTVNGQSFDFGHDPNWIGEGNVAHRNESVVRPYHQFGYSGTRFAGGDPGELGGIIWRDEQPSFYGAPTEPLSLNDSLQASGTLALRSAGADSAVYLGWFSASSKRAADRPEYERRQSSYLGVLLEGPSRAGHYFRPGYGTSDGAGSNADRGPIVLPDGRVHRWSLHYEPNEADGAGRIRVMLDDQEVVMPVTADHREAGADFDRFGLFNMQSGGWHVEFYVDNLRYTTRSDSSDARSSDGRE